MSRQRRLILFRSTALAAVFFDTTHAHFALFSPDTTKSEKNRPFRRLPRDTAGLPEKLRSSSPDSRYFLGIELNGKSGASLAATASQHIAAACGPRTLQKPMRSGPLALLRLVRSFHGNTVARFFLAHNLRRGKISIHLLSTCSTQSPQVFTSFHKRIMRV
jgi:hypothetical protein